MRFLLRTVLPLRSSASCCFCLSQRPLETCCLLRSSPRIYF